MQTIYFNEDDRAARMIANSLDVNRAFGRHLKELREKVGFSQTELASRSGIGRPTIANLEAGGQAASLHQLFALSHALGLEACALIPDLEPLQQGGDVERLLRHREELLRA